MREWEMDVGWTAGWMDVSMSFGMVRVCLSTCASRLDRADGADRDFRGDGFMLWVPGEWVVGIGLRILG